MYYICKFSDTWSVFDTNKRTSRILEGTEIACLRSLFPALLDENKILVALHVNFINPNKLLQLSVNSVKEAPKKATTKIESKGQPEKTA